MGHAEFTANQIKTLKYTWKKMPKMKSFISMLHIFIFSLSSLLFWLVSSNCGVHKQELFPQFRKLNFLVNTCSLTHLYTVCVYVSPTTATTTTAVIITVILNKEQPARRHFCCLANAFYLIWPSSMLTPHTWNTAAWFGRATTKKTTTTTHKPNITRISATNDLINTHSRTSSFSSCNIFYHTIQPLFIETLSYILKAYPNRIAFVSAVSIPQLNIWSARSIVKFICFIFFRSRSWIGKVSIYVYLWMFGRNVIWNVTIRSWNYLTHATIDNILAIDLRGTKYMDFTQVNSHYQRHVWFFNESLLRMEFLCLTVFFFNYSI